MQNDQKKEFVKELTGGGKLFHVVNAAGDSMSIIEDKHGTEILSSYRAQEAGMIKYWGRQAPYYQ